MKTTSSLCLLLCAIWLFSGCSNAVKTEYPFEVQGMNFTISTSQSASNETGTKAAVKVAQQEIETRLAMLMGDESELAILNASRGPIDASPQFLELINLTLEMKTRTDGYWAPFFGKINQLWDINHPEPIKPNADTLEAAVKEAKLTKILINDKKQIQIIGGGIIDFGRVGIAWAIDGAAQKMIDSGIKSGLIESGTLYRLWGKPEADKEWAIILQSPQFDSLQYQIKPPEGGLAEINRHTHGFKWGETEYHRTLDLDTGLPPEEPFGVTISAPNCVTAEVFAETALIFGREEVFMARIDKWEAEEIGVFMIYPVVAMRFSAEASPILSSVVNSEIP